MCRHPALTSTAPVKSGHLHRRGRRRGRPVAELPEVVLSPAPHRAVGQHRARVGAPAADGGGTGDAAHRHRRGRIRVGPVAELRVAVPSPAPQRAVPQHRAGVIGPGREGGGAGDAAHGHRLGGSGIGGGAVPELPFAVLAPAPHRGVREQRTRVSIPGREADGAGEAVHRDGSEREGAEAPVAALPGLAQSPAPRRAVRKQRARELVAGGDMRRGGEAADRDEHRGIRPAAIAELSELVPSRALRRPVGKAHAGVFAAG